MNQHVHIFVGAFASLDSACEYTEPQWNPEPDEDATNQEYKEWEDRNPSWKMRADLDVYLDSDFVGTSELETELEHLGNLLVSERDLDHIRAVLSPEDNILVQIFSEALGGFSVQMKPTPKLKYCGLFECDLRRQPEHLGLIPASVHFVLETPGTVMFAGQGVRVVKIGAQGLVVGCGDASTDQPFLNLTGLPEAEGVAPIQMRIYCDQFDQWVIEDCAFNGLTWVNNTVLNGERSMPWHQSRVKVGNVEFTWNCFTP